MKNSAKVRKKAREDAEYYQWQINVCNRNIAIARLDLFNAESNLRNYQKKKAEAVAKKI